MRHRVKKISRLGRQADHRGLLIRNLATSLVVHGKIQTSAAKAAALQSKFERVIANLKKKSDDREAVRYLKSILLTEKAQKKVLGELKAKYADRKSGFTRITPISIQKGDATPKVQIELI
ncbi:MAG: 50S ribosomal protein L17 [Candidatus Peribacteraceae bacterium]|nr:50S ribosomal protein L17 [Candidatus Peribacteraceae bacterium]